MNPGFSNGITILNLPDVSGFIESVINPLKMSLTGTVYSMFLIFPPIIFPSITISFFLLIHPMRNIVKNAD